MNIEVKKEQLKFIIMNYLDKNYYPDYSWIDHDFYKKELDRFNSCTFIVNSYEAYTYYNIYNHNRNVLEILPWVHDELTLVFGDMWVSAFKEWFEKNTGLEVDLIDS